eukprot:21119_5
MLKILVRCADRSIMTAETAAASVPSSLISTNDRRTETNRPLEFSAIGEKFALGKALFIPNFLRLWESSFSFSILNFGTVMTRTSLV